MGCVLLSQGRFDTFWHGTCYNLGVNEFKERGFQMKKAYFLISHNQFAEGLKNALEMIIGKQDNLQAYGLIPGGHPDEIIAKIKEQITDEMEVVILGDIAGGSVCNSALGLTMRPNVVLVTGTNLPLAMEIVVSQTTKKADIDAIIASAREGMKSLAVDLNIQSGGDDFF